MHTFLTRGNAILAYTLSVSACLTFCCFLSTVFIDYRANATLNTVKVVVKNVPDYSASREKNDLELYSTFTGLFNCFFNSYILNYICLTKLLHLTPLFNWNVKQLFLYLTAEYQTENNEFNQVVLWDKIVLRGDNAVLDFKNMNTKYYFWDDGKGLRGNKNVTLTLSWNIIPNAGLLPSVNALGSHTFAFPPEYTTLRV
ncbi:Signal peptidase complex subunit 3 [Trachymyrmex septentrionalis]|uniref:Signal peptidase complex subunit 3 n=1 Tax=Trachymyrmex septentrionalis TaxID=34720 RepID=A0A195F957_9HYME|nr:Signal peptidase complex subunit 3 [Trachymyrmex septentrionalis]